MAGPESFPKTKRSSSRPRTVEPSSARIAHTLTACCRCRQRKTRCDTGLPRCGPCEKTNSICEYHDQIKGVKIPRLYVVHLQHKVRDLELQLEALENDDEQYEPNDEDLVRPGASVRIKEHEETKFLGPSSGIAITRLVMQLAKKFTESESISDIIDQTKQQEIKDSFAQEESKPDSKVYPLISHIAAEHLPDRQLTDQLVRLFNAKVMAMYPFLHEPTFWKSIDDVYNGETDAFNNFAVRMVIAISLQRLETKFAGLADSFYLAALRYLEDAIKPMDVKTVQCFLLIGCYSLLTPTRTAVYYVIGLATRLVQALGLCDEKTIAQCSNGQPATFLEIDMKRRLFWCVMVMEFGLAHSMGRASCFPVPTESISVNWYELVDDQYISKDGITPNAPSSLKKWISRHFFRMRLLQLDIRRKLYQSKRPTPEDENDPWFQEMEKNLNDWRDETPNTDAGSGLNQAWFQGRYNTMVVFLLRPSPQCPNPSIQSALKCFEACQYNIYMHQSQIKNGNVDMTWIFTQAMFMNVNTILWTLSFEEIRKKYSSKDVETHLKVALECIKIASERWPGVISALELYKALIAACMRIYDKDGDVPCTFGSPQDSTGYESRSNTSSPIVQLAKYAKQTISSKPQERQPSDSTSSPNHNSTNGSIGNKHHKTIYYTPPSSLSIPSPSFSFTHPSDTSSQSISSDQSNIPVFDPALAAFETCNSLESNQLPLPATFSNLDLWNPSFDMSSTSGPSTIPALSSYDLSPSSVPANLNESFNNSHSTGPQTPTNFQSLHPNIQAQTFGIPTNIPLPQLSPSAVPWTDYLYAPSTDPSVIMMNMASETSVMGLNGEQQAELMASLSGKGGMIQGMVDAADRVYYPPEQRSTRYV